MPHMGFKATDGPPPVHLSIYDAFYDAVLGSPWQWFETEILSNARAKTIDKTLRSRAKRAGLLIESASRGVDRAAGLRRYYYRSIDPNNTQEEPPK